MNEWPASCLLSVRAPDRIAAPGGSGEVGIAFQKDMPTLTSHAIVIVAALAVATFPLRSEGQARGGQPADSGSRAFGTVTPGAYRAGPFARAVLGTGWRDIWLTPVNVPVFDLGTFGGGMKVDKRGGNFQSITLHMTEEAGWHEYRFRSVDKFPMRNLPPTLSGTTVGAYLQDQVSTLFPAAPLVVPPFLRAIGALHVVPSLYVMGDDPRLGSHRETFAGMLGTVELKGQEAPDDKPGFAGSSKIKETDKFFEDFAESRAHRIDEREFLAVRLIDFLINDPDRTSDNFDWARFGEKGNYSWRPIPRDRDRAFTDAGGFLNRFVVRKFYPKAIEFGPRYSLEGLTEASHRFDRRLLQRLTAGDFEQVARRVQRAVGDDVIEEAIAALPREWREQTGVAHRLRTTLIARRARLPEVAKAFYRELAGETDIILTADAERVDVMRLADGRVTVTVPEGTAAAQIAETRNADGSVTRTMDGSVESRRGERPFFQRTFLPTETNEIRIYLGKGRDSAVVRGAPSKAIIVRVIGGQGDDALADSAGGGATVLYDSDGDNQFITTSSTRVRVETWVPPKLESGMRLGQAWRPDWGGSAGWSPAVTYTEGAGVIVGAGPRFRSYGFRRLPHHLEAGANLLVGTGNGRLALTADADYRTENSPLAFTLAARASQLEAIRFYGYGNDTPDAGRDLSLVEQTVVAVEPSLVWHIGWRAREGLGNALLEGIDSAPPRSGLRPVVGRLHVGPVLYWTDPQPRPGSPLAAASVLGANSFGHAGVALGVELDGTDRDPIPTRGWNLRANLAGYSPGLDVTESFQTAAAVGAAYVPLSDDGPHLALRAGGSVASGNFPVQYAPAVGGSSTVRGYRWQRYTGDAAANASTELRVPIGTVNFLVRSKLGVFGLADVGRVWFDGRSDGGWHTGLGGGLWLSALGQAVSLTYARGDEQRFYLKSGLAF